jgi:hypothetical protein
MPPATRARKASKASPMPAPAPAPSPGAPTLLDALAHAPAAAELVVAALKRAKDRKDLRLAHTQLRDAVGEATTKLVANQRAPWRLLTPARWPRLEELTLSDPGLALVEALGAETWGGVCMLRLKYSCADPRYAYWGHDGRTVLGAPCARALTAALQRMPALRELELREVRLPDASAEELFRVEAAPQLRSLTIEHADLSPAAARMLAATGWRLEELDLSSNGTLGAASDGWVSRTLGAVGVAALLAAPTFALRFLDLSRCRLDAADLLSVANAPWPLEELDLSGNSFSAASAAPALAALSRHRGLRGLSVDSCHLSAASFKALVESDWPALTYFSAIGAMVAFDGQHALGAAAFAAFPALEALDLTYVRLHEAGAALLASQRCAHLEKLSLCCTWIGRRGVAALARGEWPALKILDLRRNYSGAPLAPKDARRWALVLATLLQR